jgi:hypothetical protein
VGGSRARRRVNCSRAVLPLKRSDTINEAVHGPLTAVRAISLSFRLNQCKVRLGGASDATVPFLVEKDGVTVARGGRSRHEWDNETAGGLALRRKVAMEQRNESTPQS